MIANEITAVTCSTNAGLECTQAGSMLRSATTARDQSSVDRVAVCNVRPLSAHDAAHSVLLGKCAPLTQSLGLACSALKRHQNAFLS